MNDPRVADLVAQTILIGAVEKRFYELHAWVVMPNHVHMLILPTEQVLAVMKWLKGRSAREANQILGRTGLPFWQRDSFDHYLRRSSDLWRFIDYIEANPVRAGLIGRPEDWKWSSAARRKLAGGAARPTMAWVDYTWWWTSQFL